MRGILWYPAREVLPTFSFELAANTNVILTLQPDFNFEYHQDDGVGVRLCREQIFFRDLEPNRDQKRSREDFLLTLRLGVPGI
jgi:hypothetical protein